MSLLHNRVRQKLGRLDAPRVLTSTMLARLADTEKAGVSRATVTNLINAMEAAGDIRKVTRGTYLNRCLPEPSGPAEAAHYVRRGAVVSLHTVLGDAGILNNYTHDVWCVVPLARNGSETSSRSVTAADGTRFHFRLIPERRLFAPDRRDIMQTVPYPRATPEAALCHWLYLWKSPRSAMSALPNDLDLEGFDMERARQIAEAMGIGEAMRSWAKTADLDYEQDVGRGLGF